MLLALPQNSSPLPFLTLIRFPSRKAQYLTDYTLCTLIATVLRTFSLGLIGTNTTGPAASFLRRTSTITTLRLCTPPQNKLVSAIAALTNLSTLVLGSEDYTSDFPNADFLKALSANACPDLSKLHFQLIDVPNMKSVREFISSRATGRTTKKGGANPIYEVSFDCLHDHRPNEESGQDKWWFRNTVEIGLWKFHDLDGGVSEEYKERRGYHCLATGWC